MKASLKLEYSLRVLSQLARRHRGTAVTRIEELARLEDIPANYLVQLLNELREGGLVVSKRGKTGGYRLAKEAEDITLKQVLAVVEPELVATKITAKSRSVSTNRSPDSPSPSSRCPRRVRISRFERGGIAEARGHVGKVTR